MYVGPSLWILLSMTGISTVPRGQHPCARACLFAFHPPLVGAKLGHESGSHSFFCKHFCLRQCPAADLKLPWTEGPDKLVVGVT
jgi:hypothetical protein